MMLYRSQSLAYTLCTLYLARACFGADSLDRSNLMILMPIAIGKSVSEDLFQISDVKAMLLLAGLGEKFPTERESDRYLAGAQTCLGPMEASRRP